VKFNEGGPGLTDDARAELARLGHEYILYDTGKLLNTFLQVDGNRLCHEEHPNLMHIGGLSHYLSPPRMVVHEEGGEPEPDWARWKGMGPRFEVARFTADLLRGLCEGRDALVVPDGLEPAMAARLTKVRDALIAMVARHRDELADET
jgi:hypothetical protein